MFKQKCERLVPTKRGARWAPCSKKAEFKVKATDGMETGFRHVCAKCLELEKSDTTQRIMSVETLNLKYKL